MAKKTIKVSDISGKEIADGEGATVRVTFEDARRGAYEIDATVHEVQDLISKGRKVARRGRRPKNAAA